MATEQKFQDRLGIVKQLPVACSDEAKAVEFMERLRWKGHPFCPHCGTVDECRQMASKDGGRNKRFLWRCYACKKQFSVKVGTVMEDSRIAHRIWLTAFWLACSSKKGVSALQIRRVTRISYKSALFLMHRIRFAMSQPAGPLLGSDGGTVEADETYIGGQPRHPSKMEARKWRETKQSVVGIVERGGRLRPIHVERERLTLPGLKIKDLVKQHVSKDARVFTDESAVYRRIGEHFEGGHEVVNHSRRQYVRPEDIHTNTIEGFFALLKRGLHGTFHSVSAKHLHRYLDEFAWRYSLRNVDDGERTMLAIQAGDGKRLTYRDQRKA
jgi:transposase-like protein